MAITKIQSESLNLADDFAFTGTITGAGESNSPSFAVERTTDFGFSSGTVTKWQGNSVKYDTHSGWDNSNYRYTIQSGHAGKYLFSLNCLVAEGNGTMNRTMLRLYKNGSQIAYHVWDSGNYNKWGMYSHLSWSVDCAEGDYFEMYTYGLSSSGYTMYAKNYGNQFCGFKISS